MLLHQNFPEYWIIFQADTLILGQGTAIQALLDAGLAGQFKTQFLRHFFLGHFHHASFYCAELPTDLRLPAEVKAIPFRRALDVLGQDWYSIASKAHAILNWDRNHRYCGRCGTETEHRGPAFERVCTACHLMFYPRISPSIIVRIVKNKQILMARSAHFPPGSYALIAGFIEAGESVEQAVHREVYEEVGIYIKNLQYFGSQPWPFPDSLMLAFTADYASGTLQFNDGEIEDANWYDFDKLPGRPSSTISIASQLINDFVKQQSQG